MKELISENLPRVYRQKVPVQQTTIQKEKLRDIYHGLVPETVRKTIYRVRKGYPKNYPTTISTVFENLKVKFKVHSILEHERARNLSYESNYLKEFLEIIENTSKINFWDVGAYVGVWTLLAAKKNKNCQIWSFEPEPECRAALNRNLLINHIDKNRVTTLPYAISNEQKIIQLYSSGLGGGCAAIINALEHKNIIQVETNSVDNLIEQRIADEPQIMKVDIEGAEILLIKGMNRFKPKHLFIEIHPQLLEDFYHSSKAKLWEEILNRNYKPISIGERKKSLLCHFELISNE